MNIASIFRDSWRITWHAWQLWLLSLGMFAAVVPAVILAGALGGAAAVITLPVPYSFVPGLGRLRSVPAWGWILIALAALALLVVTSAMSWALQAASMRGAALMAERGTLLLGEALALGWQRVFSLLKLSLTLGVLIAAIGVLPPLLLVLLAPRFEFLLPLMNMAQIGLAPVSMVLSIALLLIMMSIALEDLRPRAAMRRAWSVFRQGWWGFLLVLGLSALPGFALGLLVIPLVFVIPLMFFNLLLGGALLLVGCGIAGLLGLALLLFTAVFTTVLYTLIYRAAARQLGAQPFV